MPTTNFMGWRHDTLLVTVLDLKEATRVVNHLQVDYGVYALYLKNGVECTLKYGRHTYDYQEGTVVSFSPGRIIGVESETDVLAPDVVGLMFHPDLFYGTPLAAKIKNYSFLTIHSERPCICRWMSGNCLSNVLTV